MDDNLIRSITIDGFRAFEHFELHDLGRVNLLVGKNNSGKTSVLEAIQIGVPRVELSGVWNVLVNRGDVEKVGGPVSEYLHNDLTAEISELFHGYDLTNAAFEVVIFTSQDRRFIVRGSTSAWGDFDSREDQSHFQAKGLLNDPVTRWLNISVEDTDEEWKADIPLLDGKLLARSIACKTRTFTGQDIRPVEFLPPHRFSSADLAELFEKVRMRSGERDVVSLLKCLDDRVWGISSNQSFQDQKNDFRKSFRVNISGFDKPLPISSLGDGAWQLLGLAVSFVSAREGVLLVDEIDTGLHYSVMEEMWKLIYQGAEKMNVQVFATTHSRDCVEALSAIATDDEGNPNDVTIQRIEQGKSKAVSFRGNEIKVVAERDIEVR